MKPSWIVVANGSYAKIFELNGRELHKIQQIDYPDGRKKLGEILSDRPGRTQGVQSPRHALGTKIDERHEIQRDFAIKIADILKKAHAENAFERLILIASPHLLGELRNSIDETTKKAIFKEFGKDLPEKLSDSEVKEYLKSYLNT